MGFLRKDEGITLVSLVITIVIMLILAGVSIKFAIGENGLFTKVMQIKEMSLNAQNKEEKDLDKMSNDLDDLDGSSLKGKKALFIGDSIAYGHVTGGNGFGYYINEEEQFDSFTNAAVSGTRYAANIFSSSESIVNQLFKCVDNTYDYVIIEGGYNDVVAGSTLGSETDGNYDMNSLNYSTTIGELERTFYYASKFWPNAKIGFVISYKLPSGKVSDENATALWNMVKKTCDKWNVKYLDFYAGSTEYNGETKTYTELFDMEGNSHSYIASDKLHPTDEGYKFMCPYIAKWMRGLPQYSLSNKVVNGNIAMNFNEIEYRKGAGISGGLYVNNGVTTIAAPFISSDNLNGQLIKVKPGAKIGVTSGRNLRYAVYEMDKDFQANGGQTGSGWIDGDLTLQSTTEWIKIAVKNGNDSVGYTDFTTDSINELSSAIQYK